MATQTLKIPNISCEHCVKTIKRELEMLDAVTSVAGEVETKLVTVEYAAGTDFDEIRRTLEEIGYPAED